MRSTPTSTPRRASPRTPARAASPRSRKPDHAKKACPSVASPRYARTPLAATRRLAHAAQVSEPSTGKMGMGSVWVAEHLSLHTNVVVKFMAAELAKSPEALARFSREAAAASQV